MTDKRFSALFLTMLMAAAAQTASASDRATINFDRNWRFHLGDVTDGQKPDLDDSSWRKLDVPHDWSIEGTPQIEQQQLPALSIVEGKWHFHRGDDPNWKKPDLKLDGWETVRASRRGGTTTPNYNDQNCYGWYRRTIEIPKEYRGKTFVLNVGRIDDCDVTYFNGQRIGATGRMPPSARTGSQAYRSAWENVRLYKVPEKLVKDGANVVAVRAYNGEGKGGMYDAAAAIKREGPFDPTSPAGDGGGYLDGGIGWYRKTFDTPAEAKGKRVWIEFDGAYMDSEVWLNDTHLGRHPYGYTSFYYDITDALKPEGRNVLAVRLNVEQPCSRWYSGAGIFRHVRLVAVNPVHIAHWGTYVTTPTISADEAEVKVATQVQNQGDKPVVAQLGVEVIGPDAKVFRAAGDSPKLSLAPGEEKTIVQTVKVPQPKLWSPDDPQMYRATSHVTVAGETADFLPTDFGIRTVEFTKNNGMLINGRRVQVKGVCDHHDLGCLGSAVNRRAIQRQLQILKGMGCNAIRTSHNPPDPMLLDLCDTMGFVVMDEAFDEWKNSKTPRGYGRFFDEWSERDIVSMLRRDRNHPSIVLWSIGNEIPEQRARNGGEMARRLSDFCHRTEDPTRLTTSACNSPVDANRTGFASCAGRVRHQLQHRRVRAIQGPVQPDRLRDRFGLEHARRVRPKGRRRRQAPRSARGRSSGHVVRTGGAGLGLQRRKRPAGDHALALGGRRVRLDRLRLHRRADSTTAGRPHRSSYFGIIDLAGFPKGPVLLLSQPSGGRSRLSTCCCTGIGRAGKGKRFPFGPPRIAGAASSCSSTASR